MNNPIFVSTNRKLNNYEKDTGILKKLFADDKFNDGRLGADEIQCVTIDCLNKFEVIDSNDCFLRAQRYMVDNKKNCLFFAHGFNNTWEDAYKAARKISDLYDVVVIMFSFPSAITGIPFEDYREKKKYAMKSCGALDRTLGKLYKLIQTSPLDCKMSINALLHSMAGYMFQGCVLGQGHYFSRKQIFDNIIYEQIDVNAHTFKKVLELTNVRKEEYITINCKDRALFASSLKVGKKQKRRRGRTTRYIEGEAVYVDFTSKEIMGKEHTFFKGFPADKNVEEIHNKMINGFDVEEIVDGMNEVIPHKLYRVF